MVVVWVSGNDVPESWKAPHQVCGDALSRAARAPSSRAALVTARVLCLCPSLASAASSSSRKADPGHDVGAEMRALKELYAASGTAGGNQNN